MTLNSDFQAELMQQMERRYGYFYQTAPLEDMSETLQDTQFSYIYNLYDELMERYPNLVTKRLLGSGYNVEGMIDEDYPIYEYTFTPLQTIQAIQDEEDTLLDEPPVILMTSGVHGTEKTAVYGLYQVFKQMLDNPYQHERVHRLKHSFTFKVIPVVTPGGYNLPKRENPRGVNINRNFSYGYDTVEADAVDSGSAAHSEIETQIVYHWMSENRGVFAYLDFHNFIRNFYDRKVSMSSYQISPNPAMNSVYSAFVRKMSPFWKEKYLGKYANEDETAYGFLLGKYYNTKPTTINEAYHTFDIKLSATPESSNQDPDDLTKFNTKAALELTVDIYMNYILEMAEKFSREF